MRLRTLLIASAAALVSGLLAVQAQVPGVNSTLNSVFTLAYDNSTMKPTYSATSAPFSIANNATDVCTLSGSATKTLKVRRVIFGAIATTAVTDPIAIVKRSTANSGGTSLTLTNASYDSSNAAPTGVAANYTANPTLGTIQAILADPMYSFGNLTTGGARGSAADTLEFGKLGQPIVLRGVAQSVAVNLNAGSFPGALGSCTFEWTEE